MGKQRKKTRRDVAEIALSVVRRAIGEKLPRKLKPELVESPKLDNRNPAAVPFAISVCPKAGKRERQSLVR